MSFFCWANTYAIALFPQTDTIEAPSYVMTARTASIPSALKISTQLLGFRHPLFLSTTLNPAIFRDSYLVVFNQNYAIDARQRITSFSELSSLQMTGRSVLGS